MFFKSVKYALSGIYTALKSGRNLRMMFICLFLVIAVSFILGLSSFEWAVLLLCCAGAISLEMVNSSLEAVVNSITSEYKPFAKKAKDIAAGAVFVFSLFTVVIALLIFIPHVVKLLSGG